MNKLNPQMTNKYLVLAGVLLAQVTIAGLYAWSIFATALEGERGWGENEIYFAYSLAQFVFAFTTIFSGRLVDRRGPRPALLIGGLLYGGGLLLSSFAASPFSLYLTYGAIMGMGVGFVYVCPLSTLIKWFPDHPGMMTGLSVAVFGGGSILFKEVITLFLERTDVAGAFFGLGLLSASLILIGAVFTSDPPGTRKKQAVKGAGDYATWEMLRTGRFYVLWSMFALAVIPGLLVLGAAKNIGLEVAGLTVPSAAGLITVLALSNAGSRLLTGILADRFGPLNVLRAVYLLTIASLLTVSYAAGHPLFFYPAIIGIALGYGGFLTLFPTLTNRAFGSWRYGSNYGVIFQAYGLAALAGVFIKTLAGSYAATFLISALAAGIGLLLSFALRKDDFKHSEPENN